MIGKLFKITAAFALVGLICCIPAYIFVFRILPERENSTLKENYLVKKR